MKRMHDSRLKHYFLYCMTGTNDYAAPLQYTYYTVLLADTFFVLIVHLTV
jgi:hypothetical protein